MGSIVVGVDVGGTNVKLGLINSDGRILARANISTKQYADSQRRLIKALIFSILQLLKENGVAWREVLGVGLGMPGLVDTSRGFIHILPNIPGWKRVPLKAIMERELKLPVFVDNDVNVITLGEWMFGAGNGIKNLICITLGTGVGSGLILDNALYRGEGYTAGELGHVPLLDQGPLEPSRKILSLEQQVGNAPLQRQAAGIFKRRDITLEEVTRLAEQGNKRAVRFWKDAGFKIGFALVSVVNLLNPKRIVIGGGVANAHKFLFKTIDQTIKQYAMEVPANMVRIVRARLGSDAGIIGNQVLVNTSLMRQNHS